MTTKVARTSDGRRTRGAAVLDATGRDRRARGASMVNVLGDTPIRRRVEVESLRCQRARWLPGRRRPADSTFAPRPVRPGVARRITTGVPPMSSSFPDHFSDVAAQYARFRPRYPREMFAWLASRCPSRDSAWDCATGSGQAAVALADHFDRVIATDASADQIAHARPHRRVEYRVAVAEHSGLASRTQALVTVAQAMHWLDPVGFFDEVRRVLLARGLIAVWAYERLQIGLPPVQQAFDEFHDEIVGPYWPPERALVVQGYRSVHLPFEELEVPPFAIRQSMTPEMLAGYAGTWSATRRYREQRGADPVPPLRARLDRVWPGGEPQEVTWPLTLRVGRNAG
jgi:SAM-dependent methyltransferase